MQALEEQFPDWQVLQAAEADVDRNGADEVVLLVEKPGSFGNSRPFWVTDEDDPPVPTWHVFVYRVGADGRPDPLWMSSSLGVEVVSMDVDGEGLLHLVSASGGRTTWRWARWGFDLVEEAPGGGESEARASAAASDVPGSDMATLTLLVTGDNIAHAGVLAEAYDPRSRTFDFSGLYTHIADLVASYDVAVVGQETVLVADASQRGGWPSFATPVSMADALADAGFDVVLAASNHVNDRGTTAIDQTLSYWEGEYPQIEVLGIHATQEDVSRTAVIERNGIRLALFDYTYGLNGNPLPAGEQWRVDLLDGAGTERLLAGVRASKGADVVICFLHIGEEYARAPSPEVADLVDQLIDAGADAVVCAHPHVLQPYGTVTTAAGNEGVVFYSLGNLVAQQDDPATIVGGLASIVIEKPADGPARIVSCELIPTVCHRSAGETTTVYLLDDYTDAQASSHRLSTDESPLTLDGLRGYVPKVIAE